MKDNQLNPTCEENQKSPIFTAIVMGISGAGKSTLINAILGEQIANVDISSDKGVTEKISLYDRNTTAITLLPKKNRQADGYPENYRVKIYDVPGFDKNKFNAAFFTKTIKEKELDPDFSNRPNVIIYCINPNIRFNAIANETRFINDIREFTKEETGKELPIVFAFTKSIMSKEDLILSKKAVADSINRDSELQNERREQQGNKTIELEKITPDDIVETLAMPMNLTKDEENSESSEAPQIQTIVPAYGVSQLVKKAHQKCEAGVVCSRELYRKNKSATLAAASATPTLLASGALAVATMLIPGWQLAAIACAAAGGITFLGGTGLAVNKDALSKLTDWYKKNEKSADAYLAGLKKIDSDVAKLQNDIRIASKKEKIQKDGDTAEADFKLYIEQSAPNNGTFSIANAYKINPFAKYLVRQLSTDYGLNLTEQQIDSAINICVDKAEYVPGNIFTQIISETYRQCMDQLYIDDYSKKSMEEKDNMVSEFRESVQTKLNAFCNDFYEENIDYFHQEQPYPVYVQYEPAYVNGVGQAVQNEQMQPVPSQIDFTNSHVQANDRQNPAVNSFDKEEFQKWLDRADDNYKKTGGNSQSNRQAMDFNAINSQFGHAQNRRTSQADSFGNAQNSQHYKFSVM